MQAVANSSTAMQAVANSSKALKTMGESNKAMVALANSKLSKKSPDNSDFSDGKKMILLGSLYSGGTIVDSSIPDKTSELNAEGKRQVTTKYGGLYVSLDRVPVTFTKLNDYNSNQLVYIPIY